MHAVNFQFLLFLLTGPHAVKEDLSSFGAFLMLLKYRYRDRVEIPRTVIKLLHMYHPQDGYESYMKVYLFLTFFHYFVKEVHCLSLPKSLLNKLTDFHESYIMHHWALFHLTQDGADGDNDDNNDGVRFQILTAASMKIAAFWNIAPCNLEVDGDCPDDGGSMYL
jgi:hypothetical protein